MGRDAGNLIGEGAGDAQQKQRDTRRKALEDAFLAAEITEGADVGNDEGGGKAILRADLAEVDAAIFEGEAAAAPVVADLHKLVLQGLVGEVVANPGSEIETPARQVSVAKESANLVGEGLLKRDKTRWGRWRKVGFHGVGIQAEMGEGGEEFAVGLYFEERADGDEALNLRIVLENLFEVVDAARSDPKIADNGRPVARTECKGKGRNRVEGQEHIALAIDYGTAEGGVEVMLLKNAPGEQLLGLVVASFGEEPLGDAVFDFVGIGQGGVGVEADEVREIIYARDIAIGDGGLDGVFEPLARLTFVERGTVEKTLESGRTQLNGKFAGIAHDRTCCKWAKHVGLVKESQGRKTQNNSF